MTEIEGYKVLLLRLEAGVEHCHSLYMREHFIRVMDPNKPRGRTLFLLNIPPYIKEKHLWSFFKNVGTVINVAFAEKPGRDEAEKWRKNCTAYSINQPPFKFKVAYIVFKERSALESALKLNSLDLFNSETGESLIESGLQLWHTVHKKHILDEEQTQARIQRYMTSYDQRKKKEREADKNSQGDADGWVTVGKEGRNSGFEQKETVINRLEDKIVKSKKKELTNFYTFQIRESKLKNIVDLRKKFEEDKRKICLLKQTRRFRPF